MTSDSGAAAPPPVTGESRQKQEALSKETPLRILILDIETSPHNVHTWGLWNQNIGINQIIEAGSVLCFAAKWYGEKKVFFHSVKKDGMEGMLKAAAELLDEADVVVGYNSKKFDIPWLQGMFLVHGIDQPSPFKQIDLLTTAKTKFKLASNKLSYVAKILGLPAKKDTGGHELWIDCMAGDEKAWNKMRAYNVHDVRLTEMVYDKFKGFIRAHPNHGLYTHTPSETLVCINCGSERVHTKAVHYTAVNKYQRYRCYDCGKWMRGTASLLTKEERQGLLRDAE